MTGLWTLLCVLISVAFTNALPLTANLSCWTCENAMQENDCYCKNCLAPCDAGWMNCFAEVFTIDATTFFTKGCATDQMCSQRTAENPIDCNTSGHKSIESCITCCQTTGCNGNPPDPTEEEELPEPPSGGILRITSEGDEQIDEYFAPPGRKSGPQKGSHASGGKTGGGSKHSDGKSSGNSKPSGGKSSGHSKPSGGKSSKSKDTGSKHSGDKHPTKRPVRPHHTTKRPRPTRTPKPTTTRRPRPTHTPKPTTTRRPRPTHTPKPTTTRRPRPTRTPKPTQRPTHKPTKPEPVKTTRPKPTPRPTKPKPTWKPNGCHCHGGQQCCSNHGNKFIQLVINIGQLPDNSLGGCSGPNEIIVHQDNFEVSTEEPTPTPQPTTPTPKPTTSTPKPTTSTPKPTTPKPTTQKPTTPKPTTQKPTTPKPTTQKPTTPKPTTPTPKPTTAKPMQCYFCVDEDCYVKRLETCSHEMPFCGSQVVQDNSGRRQIKRGCQKEEFCLVDWWQNTSQKLDCHTLDDGSEGPSGHPISCSFCCVTSGCNENLVPHFNSLYLPPGFSFK